jgi:DNA-binding response OmpR family regulator
MVGVVAADAEAVVLRAHPPNSLFGIASGRSSRGTAQDPGGGPEQPPPAACGLVLDSEAFMARLGAKECFLGNTREFDVLARLLRRPGRFVSHDALRVDVWDDIETETNTIHRTVTNLRRKLAKKLPEVVIDGSQKKHYRVVVPAHCAPSTSE